MFDLMSYARRLFLLSIITIMIYQLIDVTINYRQYLTIIKSDLTYFESGDLPSLTFCSSDYHYDFVNKFVINNIIASVIRYEFAYNIQQKSHTNNSMKQIWYLNLMLKPKILNHEEYFGIMSDVMITNISSQSLKCVTIFSKLQLNSSEQQIHAQILKPEIEISIVNQIKSNFYFLVHPSNQLVT